MPKETFYNLPDEKRMLIEKASLEEFSKNGYDKASINTIVLNCKIAKGSFYQYFKNKKDLFMYLALSVILKKKMEYVGPVLVNLESNDFFTNIRELFISGLKFATENPQYDEIGSWLLKHPNHPIYLAMFDETQGERSNIYTELIKNGINRGELKGDIDVEYTAHFVSNLITTTSEYCINLLYKKDEINFSGLSTAMMERVDYLISFLKNGIGK